MQERRHLYREKLPMRASDYFRRQGYITITDDEVALRTLEAGDARRLLWGNDYPHDEGTWPNSQAQLDSIRKALSPEDSRRVLSANAAELYGFDLEYLSNHRL